MTLDRNKLRELCENNTSRDIVIGNKRVLGYWMPALLDELEAAEGELRAVDEALARRPALADCKDRYEAISLACNSAQKLMDEGHKNLRRAESAEREIACLQKNANAVSEIVERQDLENDALEQRMLMDRTEVGSRLSVMETALRNMLAIAKGDEWQDSFTGREIIYKSAEKALEGSNG